MNISNRLKTIAQCIKPYRFIIDIGTDHALLPIYSCLNGIIDGGLACDNKEGPIQEAIKNIAEYELNDKINTRLGDGLKVITSIDVTDCIVIAGMGGKLIIDILENDKQKLVNNKRLILQPNLDRELVRIWLAENNYQITKENILLEEDIFYEIITADRTNEKVSYSETEIKFGPLLLKEKNPLFLNKWGRILSIKKAIFDRIPLHHENREIIDAEIRLIENILK